MFNNSYIDENGNEVCDNLGNSLLVYDGNKVYNVVTGTAIDNDIDDDIDNDIDDIENNLNASENTKFFYDNSKSSFYYNIYFTPKYLWNKLQILFECLYKSMSNVYNKYSNNIYLKDNIKR